MNQILAQYGLQARLADKSWEPSSQAKLEGWCSRVAFKKETGYEGYHWHWRSDIVCRIVEWWKKQQGREVAP